jgi:hypothetical protein
MLVEAWRLRQRRNDRAPGGRHAWAVLFRHVNPIGVGRRPRGSAQAGRIENMSFEQAKQPNPSLPASEIRSTDAALGSSANESVRSA